MFINHKTPVVASARRRAADDACERYLAWREASTTCESSYGHWVATAHSPDRARAFAVYAAALDREQHAAAQYEAALGL